MTIKQNFSTALLGAAALELERVSKQAEALGAQLCIDPRIAEEHSQALQSIDRISQSLSQIAKVVGAQSSCEAIDAVDEIGLQELQDQFQRVCLAFDCEASEVIKKAQQAGL